MVLTLEVIGEQAEGLGAASRKAFNAIGGTIGRLPDNDWVFPDPYVSGRHALIRYLNGKYFIEDTSTNGVFINSPDNRLSRTQPQQLRSGDVVFIDAYQIRVSIEEDPAAARRNDPLANLKSANVKGRTVGAPASRESAARRCPRGRSDGQSAQPGGARRSQDRMVCLERGGATVQAAARVARTRTNAIGSFGPQVRGPLGVAAGGSAAQERICAARPAC